MELDKKDMQIFEELKGNGRLSTQKIAKLTRIPITTVHNRIKKLEKDGYIRQYTIIPDYKKMDKGLCSLILITVNYRPAPGMKLSQVEIAKKIKRLPGVEEVLIVAGGTDIVAKLRVKDVDELNKFIIDKLRNVEGVDRTTTMVVLDSV